MSEGVIYTTERYVPRRPGYERGLKCLNGEEFLKANFPPREIILEPLLPAKGLAMIYAPRGIGKTWVALGVAHAIASGSAFLRWNATTPRRVLYIDGEMPAALLQNSLRRHSRCVGRRRASGEFPHSRCRFSAGRAARPRRPGRTKVLRFRHRQCRRHYRR